LFPKLHTYLSSKLIGLLILFFQEMECWQRWQWDEMQFIWMK